MIKPETIKKKVKRITRALDHIEKGMYADMSVELIADQINWLWKFRYISHEEMSMLADRVIHILED